MFKSLIKTQYSLLIGKSLCQKIMGNFSMQSPIVKKESKTKIKKGLSLKQITQLKNQENQHFNYLSLLLKEDKLEAYFINKNVLDLKVEDIFFLAAHHELFSMSSSICYEAIISHPQLDCCSSFSLAKDLRYLNNERCQLKLVTFFNQESSMLTMKELLFCLKCMEGFLKFIITTFVNSKVIQARANEAQPFDYLELMYLCEQIWGLEDLFNINQLKKKVIEIGKYFIQNSTNKLPQIRYFFFIENLQKTLNIKLSNHDKEQRQKIVARKITSAKSDEELEYSLNLITIYTQFTFLIRIDRLKLDLYLKYLKFLIKEKKNNPNFEPVNHQIPLNLSETKTSNAIYKIMKLREELGLDSTQQIGKLMKKIIDTDLESLHGLIKYVIEQIEDDGVFKELETTVISKFNLHRKKLQVPFTQKVIQKYDLVQIMKILAIMQKNNIASDTFKSLSLRFIFHLIQQQELIKNLSGQSQMKFIIEAYKIIGKNTIPQKLEARLVNLTLIAFANNFVSPQTLLKFATMMSNARFGNRYIWYAIQNQFTELAHTKKDHKTKQYLAKSIEQFVSMDLVTGKCFSALGIQPMSKQEFMQKQFKLKQRMKQLTK